MDRNANPNSICINASGGCTNIQRLRYRVSKQSSECDSDKQHKNNVKANKKERKKEKEEKEEKKARKEGRKRRKKKEKERKEANLRPMVSQPSRPLEMQN